MKHIVILMALALMPLGLLAQKEFDKFIDSDDVGAVIINKSLLGMVANLSADEKSKEARDFIEMAQNIDEIKVFMTDKTAASEDMEQTVKKYLKKANMDLLMQARKEDARVKFYVKSTNNDEVVKELLMFVKGVDKEETGLESVLVTMRGEIELDKIGALVNKMNLPKDLEKAGKAK